MTFKKGQSGNLLGKPVGTVSATTKLMVSVKDIVLSAFHELQGDPVNNIVAWGKANPTEFYKIAAKLIPTQLNAEVTEKKIIVLAPNPKPKKLEE